MALERIAYNTMKIIIVDCDGFELVLNDKQAKAIILNNDIQSLFRPNDDRYRLYKQVNRYVKSYTCKVCSKLIKQRDARR